MYFAQEDDVDDGENIVPMSDLLKSKLDADLDQIGRIIENRRGEHRTILTLNMLDPSRDDLCKQFGSR